ncbi:uncharacterized protein [Watersipora subatra]|uniref:uncharacterized protein n=1 Tax=Watersipora subatra TaxID=2589382 RepID=UPI00355B620F
MAKLFAVLALAAGITVCSAIIGPRNPDPRARCDEEGNKAVDTDNMCWYHECILDDDEGLRFLPRRCALGSKVGYNFVEGHHNPCTINFDSEYGYSCTREAVSIDGPPPCWNANVRPVCFNGGEPRYEAEKCWCDCPPTWLGHNDCSLPTRDVTDLPAGSNICVDGLPQEDYCSLPGNQCLNGGDCYNQCDTFWCDCKDHENNYYYGKRCEPGPL